MRMPEITREQMLKRVRDKMTQKSKEFKMRREKQTPKQIKLGLLGNRKLGI